LSLPDRQGLGTFFRVRMKKEEKIPCTKKNYTGYVRLIIFNIDDHDTLTLGYNLKMEYFRCINF